MCRIGTIHCWLIGWDIWLTTIVWVVRYDALTDCITTLNTTQLKKQPVSNISLICAKCIHTKGSLQLYEKICGWISSSNVSLSMKLAAVKNNQSKHREDKTNQRLILAVYLCFRAPLIPLLFLTAAVSAVWNELSVYELERQKKPKHQHNVKKKKSVQRHHWHKWNPPLLFPPLWVPRTLQLFQFLLREKHV